MTSLPLLIICFATGFLVKLTDLAGERSLFRGASYIFGFAYGILIAYVIVSFPLIAPLWLGAVIANTLYGRVDSKGHYAAFASLLIFLLLFWSFRISIPLLLLFALAAFADELYDSRRPKKKGIIVLRPFLELAALAVSIASSNYTIFLAIFSFDVAYNIVEYFGWRK